MNELMRWTIDLFRRDPVPREYRSTIAGAAVLLLTVSSLVVKLPPPTATQSLSAAQQRGTPIPDPSASAQQTAAPAVTGAAPTFGPTQRAAGQKPKPIATRGGVNVTLDPGGVPVADLFAAAEDHIGINSTTITLCAHAALSLGKAFNTDADDFNVYWKWLADHGGVYNRNIDMHWEDDAYSPDVAVKTAAPACQALNPFFMLGGIGFEQIPAVRKWAEDNRMLYIHHVATEDLTKKFSYSYLVTEEKLGELAGEWMVSHHRGEDIGIIHRGSGDWDPGWLAFKRVVAGKVNIKADDSVIKNQGTYTKEIKDMQDAKAATVFVWENALAAINIIEQARNQTFHPVWLLFPFNTTTDTLPVDPLDKPFEGIAAWPAYASGPHSGMYAEEMAVFEAAQAKYGTQGHDPNDILWQVWLGMKQLNQLFLDCGKDCTRNKIAGLMLTGKHKAITPGCPIDFSKNGHVAGITGNAFESFVSPANKLGWRETLSCQEHF
ncbi:MAG: ABC transporter substrate-binding protein [Actinomycetota bacterium]|nr:ABC transporter substrate-binding protein [Actinomycetota bacterium]